MGQLEDGLNSMSGGSAVLLGVILGLMMAFDMGGPLNKVAYSFAAAGVGGAALASDAPELRIMAAVMLAGMVPPIALALATVVRPGLFTMPERENGKAGWALGASFITEGAIPFAAADPLRVIPGDHAGQRRHRRPRRWRWTSRSARRTAASSCCSPSTASSATSSRWPPVSSSAPLAVIALKSMGSRDTDLATV